MSKKLIDKPEKLVKSNKEGGHFWKNFRASAAGVFSKLSKAFLLPIALLPIAGVFLGVGATITANVDAGTFGWYLGNTMNKMGDVCFGNLPVLFAISVAIAYTEDSGVAAITAVVGFLVMNGIQAGLISENWVAIGAPTDGDTLVDTFKQGFRGVFNDDGVLVGWEQLDSYKMLWWSNIPTGLITSNVGITSLNTGVFAAIFVGGISAKMYNKFHKTQLPSFISFFSGSKLVPIITFAAVIPVAFIFLFIWPGVGLGLEWFGVNSGKLPGGLDSFVYEIIERSLIPFGLHHVFYAPLWWSAAGGGINETMLSAFLDKAYASNATVDFSTYDGFSDSFLKALGLTQGAVDRSTAAAAFEKMFASKDVKLWGVVGDQTAMFAVLQQSTVKFTDLATMGLSLGRFQSGKFGFMLFALPAAAVAMWLNVPKENRKAVMGIYFSAAFTCFLTGITEPIEFTFLFLAPWLFYGVHMPLASISFLLCGLLKVHVTMTVSGGMIDFIVFGLVPMQMGTNWYWALMVAAIMTPLYFFAFYFAVKYGKVMVPGREIGTTPTALFTKKDVKSKGKDGETGSKNSAQIEKATKIIEFLGGEANIKSVDSCASRLRLTVVDSKIVNKDGIMSLGGCTGIIAKGESVHVVYGGEQEVLKPHMKEILAEQRAHKVSK